MPGFFEFIAKADQPMTAAWIIEGKNAGAKALFDRQGTVFREERFPEELAGTIRTAQAGILDNEGQTARSW